MLTSHLTTEAVTVVVSGSKYIGSALCLKTGDHAMQVPLVKQIAAKYSKHVLSLLLRWGIQRGNSVLAKSSNPHHIRGNLEGCLGWSIGEEDKKKLTTLDFQLRLVDGIRFLRPEGPFRFIAPLAAPETLSVDFRTARDPSWMAQCSKAPEQTSERPEPPPKASL